MKALTVCNPFAELFFLPADHPHLKRVENREWKTDYRGTLYIHAGKNRSWLEKPHPTDSAEDRAALNYGVPLEKMRWGMVIGTVELRHCCHIDDIEAGKYDRAFPWIRTHQHTEGKWCLVFENPKPCTPFEYKGALGLFEIPDSARPAAGAALGLPF